MDTSTPPDENSPPLRPREERIDTLAGQTAAIDELLALVTQRLQIFDVKLDSCGWNSATRAANLANLLRRAPKVRIELIVHDTRWLETSCPRLLQLMKSHAHVITVYRTGVEARAAMDPLLLVDGRHFLHRYHVDQPRATLAIEQPQLASPLVARFAEIWATGEPGLGATVLGL